jgi:hypothetical protein
MSGTSTFVSPRAYRPETRQDVARSAATIAVVDQLTNEELVANLTDARGALLGRPERLARMLDCGSTEAFPVRSRA